MLIALNVLIYILQFVTAQELTEAWFLFPYSIGSEPWRLITSAFLHSPAVHPVHLLFNMYALFIFGPVLESFLGRGRFLALYLIGALGGSLGVLTSVEVWALTDGDPQTAPGGALGASGAVFALMGAVFAMRKAMGVDIRQLLVVLVINLAIPFFVGGIAWEGHVGGLGDRVPDRPGVRADRAAAMRGARRSSGSRASRPGCSCCSGCTWSAHRWSTSRRERSLHRRVHSVDESHACNSRRRLSASGSSSGSR